VVTDWPGHFPNGPQTVAGTGRRRRGCQRTIHGPHTETHPLHWAASSDDVAVLDALLDAGADIEARGAVIGAGAPMADATAFGNWSAARRLLEHLTPLGVAGRTNADDVVHWLRSVGAMSSAIAPR
jgi:hypothetical protein